MARGALNTAPTNMIQIAERMRYIFSELEIEEGTVDAGGYVDHRQHEQAERPGMTGHVVGIPGDRQPG